MSIQLVASAYHLGEVSVTNQQFANIIDTNHDWIVQRTGIEQRCFTNQSAAELATIAAQKALQQCNMVANDIDLIIVATYSSEDIMPNCASIVKRNLSMLNEAPTFDINVACSGYVYAIEMMTALMQYHSHYRTVMVIGTETQSRYLDFSDRSTAILFGDGAAATIYQMNLDDETTGIRYTKVGNMIDEQQALVLKNTTLAQSPFNDIVSASGFIEMKGQEVFKFAVRILVKLIKDTLEHLKLSLDDIDYIVPHQANTRIIQAVQHKLNISNDKMIDDIALSANTSAASIPIALSKHLSCTTKAKPKTYLLIGFGAGLNYGINVIDI